MTTAEISRKSPTNVLEAEYDSLVKLHETLGDDQLDLAEWVEDRMEWIDAELSERDDEEPHEDSPSLQDAGIELGSYAS